MKNRKKKYLSHFYNLILNLLLMTRLRSGNIKIHKPLKILNDYSRLL